MGGDRWVSQRRRLLEENDKVDTKTQEREDTALWKNSQKQYKNAFEMFLLQ